MAITSEQRTKIIKVVVGLFNGGISAGNLTGLVTLIDNGASVSDLSDRLATGSLFTDKILGLHKKDFAPLVHSTLYF